MREHAWWSGRRSRTASEPGACHQVTAVQAWKPVPRLCCVGWALHPVAGWVSLAARLFLCLHPPPAVLRCAVPQVEKNTTIFVTGFDKELVGQFAASIRCGPGAAGMEGWQAAGPGWLGGCLEGAGHCAAKGCVWSCTDHWLNPALAVLLIFGLAGRWVGGCGGAGPAYEGAGQRCTQCPAQQPDSAARMPCCPPPPHPAGASASLSRTRARACGTTTRWCAGRRASAASKQRPARRAAARATGWVVSWLATSLGGVRAPLGILCSV